MGKTLVLAEKPSVGRDLAKVLKCSNNKGSYIEGNKYVVTDRDLYNEYRKQFKNIIYKKTWTKSKFVES